MTGSLGTVRKSAGALFTETVGVGEVSCLTVKRNENGMRPQAIRTPIKGTITAALTFEAFCLAVS